MYIILDKAPNIPQTPFYVLWHYLICQFCAEEQADFVFSCMPPIEFDFMQ